jgi:hypothetical protein
MFGNPPVDEFRVKQRYSSRVRRSNLQFKISLLKHRRMERGERRHTDSKRRTSAERGRQTASGGVTEQRRGGVRPEFVDI